MLETTSSALELLEFFLEHISIAMAISYKMAEESGAVHQASGHASAAFPKVPKAGVWVGLLTFSYG